MQSETKEAWVAALRSGKYKQGVAALCCEGSYCCLGVLYEVLCKSDPSIKKTKFGPWTFYDGQRNCLTAERRESLGMSDEQMTELMVMNDSEGKTFEQIADYVEKVL